MPKAQSRPLTSDVPKAGGIFGPNWHQWRGATLHIELADEPQAIMRLDEVKGGFAALTELDSALKPVGQRTLPWPPSGTVRVLRAP